MSSWARHSVDHGRGGALGHGLCSYRGAGAVTTGAVDETTAERVVELGSVVGPHAVTARSAASARHLKRRS
jgi:hypothetical protein